MKVHNRFLAAWLLLAGIASAQPAVVIPLQTQRPQGICFLTPATSSVTLCDLVGGAPTGASVKVWEMASNNYSTFTRAAEGWEPGCGQVMEPGRTFWLGGTGEGSYTGIYPSVDFVHTLVPTGTHLLVYPYPVPIHWTNLGLVRADLRGSGVIFFTSTAHVFRSHMRTRGGWQPAPMPDEILQPGEAFWYVAPESQLWIEARPYTFP